MFDYDARQIFVVHPWEAGGGILSSILSLDSSSAALNHKNLSLEQKITDYRKAVDPTRADTHAYGLAHFMNPNFRHAYDNADSSSTYIHKCHFYELTSDEALSMLTQMPNKQAVGICLTSACREELKKLPRGEYLNRTDSRQHSNPFRYSDWVYSNLFRLLPDYFGIDLKHSIEFRELLNTQNFLEHVCYLKDLFRLDLDIGVARELIDQWQIKIRRSV